MHQKFEREELYREVWATPMWTLAERHGLSGNGLKKICRKLNIPVPPRGYWAKLAAGHKVRPIPLPAKATETVVVRQVLPPPVDWSTPEDAEWRVGRLAFDAEVANRIEVNPRPRRWHEAVRPLRERLTDLAKELSTSRKAHERYEKWPEWRKQQEISPESWHWNSYQQGGQVMPMTHRAAAVRLSLETYRRGLAILNAFCQAAEKRGFECRYSEEKGRILVNGHGGELEVRMTEATEQRTRKVERYGGEQEDERYRVPTGRLRLFVARRWGTEREVTESAKAPLEARLEAVFRVVYAQVVACRGEARREEEERQREAIHAAERAEQARVQAEEAARRRAERKRRRDLFRQAKAWERAKLIRRYVEAKREKAGSEGLAEWSAWALAVAGEMDPVGGI